ncbi:type VI secretion system baseplate subunit TssF [Zooshikella sp. RANM57]|uniref:type VI secretion system baseplate subunit TssF n=1 Tax=Zooshikella sp. RANM57 TaxID=3425863 RepID=UPI003D6F158D
MDLSTQLKKAYSDELSFINEFNEQLTTGYSELSVDSQNPEIKQLLESVALLIARNRVTSQQHIDQLYRRLFYQLYPYLTSPVPAMALVKVESLHSYDRIQLPAKTGMIFSTPDDEYAYFQTLFDLSIEPIRLDTVSCYGSYTLQSKLELKISNQSTKPYPLRSTHFFLWAGDDYCLTLQLQQLLKDNIKKVEAEFENGCRYPCEVSIGIPNIDNSSLYQKNPLAIERHRFQLPMMASYLTIKCPEAPEQWQMCKINLIIDKPWPPVLNITRQMFQLNVVPVENLQQEEADTIEFDGVQTVWPILPPRTKSTLSLCTLEGVYQVKNNERIALHSGVVKSTSGHYAIHDVVSGNQQKHEVAINMPEAFDEPVDIIIQGRWHDPTFSQLLWKPLAIRWYEHDLPDLSLQLLPSTKQAIVPFCASITLTLEQYLALSAVKNKVRLDLGDILLILDSMGTVWLREFKRIRELLAKCYCYDYQTVSDQGKPCLGLHYVIAFHPFEDHLNPLIKAFIDRLAAILKLWITACPIKLTTDAIPEA